MTTIDRFLHQMLAFIERVFYPRACLLCDTLLDPKAEGHLCETCAEHYPLIDHPICERCGQPVGSEDALCFDCERYPHYYDQGRALFLYHAQVKSALADFKFHNKTYKARGFVHYLKLCLIQQGFQPDVIVSVPLHPKRLRQRGYNQAHLLAKLLAKEMHIPYKEHVVKRVKVTQPQNTLAQGQRQNNLEGAFSIGKKAKNCVIMNQEILVIDDIYTTGSTMDQMAVVLKDAGAKKVNFLCVAIGQGFS